MLNCKYWCPLFADQWMSPTQKSELSHFLKEQTYPNLPAKTAHGKTSYRVEEPYTLSRERRLDFSHTPDIEEVERELGSVGHSPHREVNMRMIVALQVELAEHKRIMEKQRLTIEKLEATTRRLENSQKHERNMNRSCM